MSEVGAVGTIGLLDPCDGVVAVSLSRLVVDSCRSRRRFFTTPQCLVVVCKPKLQNIGFFIGDTVFSTQCPGLLNSFEKNEERIAMLCIAARTK